MWTVCGRVTVTDPARIAQQFGLSLPAPVARYNLAPSQDLPVITNLHPNAIAWFHWGLIPSWAKDPATGHKMINARLESLAERPAYREAIVKRRCLVLCDGFFEWQKASSSKTPFYIRRQDHEPFSFAGLWDSWRAPDGQRLHSCTIITGPANRLVQPIHNRMPVVIEPADRARWLEPDEVPVDALRDLLAPPDPAGWVAYPVSPLVNSVQNDRPECIAKGPVQGRLFD